MTKELNLLQILKNERLIRAIRANDFGQVCDLLVGDADVHARHENNNTALHVAALSCDMPIITLLTRFRADPTVINSDGHTPVMLAEMQNNFKVANYLATIEASFFNKQYQPRHREVSLCL